MINKNSTRQIGAVLVINKQKRPSIYICIFIQKPKLFFSSIISVIECDFHDLYFFINSIDEKMN